MGGWDQETFYSLFEAGRLGDDIPGLFDAWSYRPTRAEPLYEVAWRLRHRRSWPAAYLVADTGRKIAMPGDILFVWPWVYEWGLEFEFSIAAHWTGHKIQARHSCERLLATPTLPEHYRRQVERNRELIG
jgi:hypothetical protein